MAMETGDYEQTEWKYQPYVKERSAQVEGPALCLECGDACKQEIQDLITLVSAAIRAPQRRPEHHDVLILTQNNCAKHGSPLRAHRPSVWVKVKHLLTACVPVPYGRFATSAARARYMPTTVR